MKYFENSGDNGNRLGKLRRLVNMSLKMLNYFSNQKLCVVINNNKNTSFQDIICGVRQGSILGLLLFILYINDLKYAYNALNPIIFADDTKLFISDKNINTLYQGKFRTAKNELMVYSKIPLNTKNQCFPCTIKMSRKIIWP